MRRAQDTAIAGRERDLLSRLNEMPGPSAASLERSARIIDERLGTGLGAGAPTVDRTDDTKARLELIADFVCRRYGVSLEQLRSSHKADPLPAARGRFAVMGKCEGFSYPVMGRFLNKHHTCLILAYRRWWQLKEQIDATGKLCADPAPAG